MLGDTKLREEFEDLSDLWTGMSLSSYIRVAHARTRIGPGVVLCCLGDNKAEIVHHLVTRPDLQLVNMLVVDEQLATALKGRLGI